jgi:hypothetical protein
MAAVGAQSGNSTSIPATTKAVVGNPGAPSEANAELAENLAKLGRYERRACSRRKRALGALIP